MKIKCILLFLAAMSFVDRAQAQGTNEYQLSTHVLDVSAGEPAQGIVVSLYKYDTHTREWEFVDKALTQQNGRVAELLPSDRDNYGVYKLRFETEPYFAGRSQQSIYPYIEVTFYVKDKAHYHIPITVSANGYATYRGS